MLISLMPKKENDEKRKCPVCELVINIPFVQSRVVECMICSECDYLIGLGFANYDEQPEALFYPVTWMYDRVYKLTGHSYIHGKRLWLDEVVEVLENIIAAGQYACDEYQQRQHISPAQALEETKEDITRVEKLQNCVFRSKLDH
jgi:hypothetical protein